MKTSVTFWLSAMYFSPMALRDSVREAAANTVSVTLLPSALGLASLPQATSESAMTSASSRDTSFFIVLFFLSCLVVFVGSSEAAAIQERARKRRGRVVFPKSRAGCIDVIL